MIIINCFHKSNYVYLQYKQNFNLRKRLSISIILETVSGELSFDT